MKRQTLTTRDRGDEDGSGMLEPLWSCSPVLPTSLVDLLETMDDQEKSEDTWEDEESPD